MRTEPGWRWSVNRPAPGSITRHQPDLLDPAHPFATPIAVAKLLSMITTLAAETFSQFAPLGVLLAMVLIFALANLVLTVLIGPNRTGSIKGMTYESGMNPIGSARRRFNVRFYIVAMTFLVLDVEIVFLLPWASVFSSLSPESALNAAFLARMLFFILTTVIAFVYAWRKGVFRYD